MGWQQSHGIAVVVIVTIACVSPLTVNGIHNVIIVMDRISNDGGFFLRFGTGGRQCELELLEEGATELFFAQEFIVFVFAIGWIHDYLCQLMLAAAGSLEREREREEY